MGNIFRNLLPALKPIKSCTDCYFYREALSGVPSCGLLLKGAESREEMAQLEQEENVFVDIEDQKLNELVQALSDSLIYDECQCEDFQTFPGRSPKEDEGRKLNLVVPRVNQILLGVVSLTTIIFLNGFNYSEAHRKIFLGHSIPLTQFNDWSTQSFYLSFTTGLTSMTAVFFLLGFFLRMEVFIQVSVFAFLFLSFMTSI